jgi:hypothetical protein
MPTGRRNLAETLFGLAALAGWFSMAALFGVFMILSRTRLALDPASGHAVAYRYKSLQLYLAPHEVWSFDHMGVLWVAAWGLMMGCTAMVYLLRWLGRRSLLR